MFGVSQGNSARILNLKIKGIWFQGLFSMIVIECKSVKYVILNRFVRKNGLRIEGNAMGFWNGKWRVNGRRN